MARACGPSRLSGEVNSASVVLCTYQGARYLPAQLESLLTQSRLPNEIVVFDDASQDQTWSMLVDFAERSSARQIAVKLHRNSTNVGYVANFAQALQHASSELVFLCDQDDVWHVDKLERFVLEFDRRPDLLMLHSDAILVDGNMAPLGYRLFDALDINRDELDRVHQGDAFSVLVRRNIATGATMAVRREVIGPALTPVPRGWIHDEWLAMLAAARGSVDCLEEACIDYRQHETNQVGARRRSLADRIRNSHIAQGEFMTRMLERTRSLMEEVEAGRLHLDDQRRRLLSERLQHARLRAHLPQTVGQRSLAVVSEYLSGRYNRFSNGARSAVGDLLRRQR